jgi:hypothetical protein
MRVSAGNYLNVNLGYVYGPAVTPKLSNALKLECILLALANFGTKSPLGSRQLWPVNMGDPETIRRVPQFRLDNG